MLPREFTRVEYIESTGSQYVDTGFKPNQDTRVVMEAIPMSVGSASGDTGMFFGSGYPVQQQGFEAYVYGGMISGVYNGVQQNGSAVSAGQRVIIDFNKNVCKITADGAVVLNHTFAAATFTSAVNLALFMLPRQSRFYGLTRVISCQIYDNGAMVRDYIPCIDKNNDANLWDDVNKTLAEKVGTFVAGPAIPAPSAPVSLRTALAVRILWDAVADADYYNIYRDGVFIGTTTDTQYIDTTVAENETYTYGISASNGGGESAQTELIVYTRTGYFLYKPYISTANFP